MGYSSLFGIIALLIVISVWSLLALPIHFGQNNLDQNSTTNSNQTSQGSTISTNGSNNTIGTGETLKHDPRIVKANSYFLSTPIDMMQWSDSQFSSLVRDLIASNVTYVFFNLPNLNQDGSLNDNFTLDATLMQRFNSLAGAHSFQYMAWTGTQENPNALLGNFTSSGIAETVTSTYNAGFDGILVDIEPVPNESPQFIVMLHDFRNSIASSAPGMLLGTNNMNVYQYVSYGQLWAWDKNYFQNVSKLVDFISPMFFESDRTNQQQYIQYLDSEIQIITQSSLSPVLYEIPDWYGPNTTNHFPLGENISNAILAFQQYVNSANEGKVPRPANMLGLGIYALNKNYTLVTGTAAQALETTAYDWSFFVNEWVNTPYPQQVGSNVP
jgi:hypothetical protein